MKRLALLSLLSVIGCGGQTGTLTLNIVTSPADDPFADAVNVRVTVGDSVTVKTMPVNMGHFNFNFSQKPSTDAMPVLVEALDMANNVVAYGKTPSISLTAVDQGPYAVWVGRPGRAAPAAAGLMPAKTEFAAVAINGLGILYAGGRDKDGNTLQTTEVYDVFTHGIIETAPMNSVRAGAVGTAVAGIRAVVFGGATQMGLATPGAPLNSVELFDPTVGTGLWAPLAGDVTDARSAANVTALPSGAALVSGGNDGNGSPLASAALISTDTSPRLTAVSGPMVAARLGHATGPAKFPDGDGAILFGGLPTGSTLPVAERLVGQSFTAYDMGDLGMQPNRLLATATALADGRVLILGGKDASGPLASGFIITPNLPATVTPVPNALSVPREGHTATRVGNDILVCGGGTTGGALDDSCDLIDGTSVAIKETIKLGAGRRDHTATVLEIGLVLIAGGTGPDGSPSGAIEIYTPKQ